MARYTITPWRTQTDLLQVRRQLYTPTEESTPDARRHAVDRIMAWKLRGNLPHAVESTALLVDAILHHHCTASNSPFSIRAVYSAAFCRFVTGFCDIGRAREGRLEPSSMLDIAKQIDMPGEFVALRHEATHEELPALQRLVVAAQQGLEWLWRVYWSRLEEPESVEAAEAKLPTFKVKARKLLRSFRSARREAFKVRKQQSSEHKAELEGLCQACSLMCAGKPLNVAALAEVFVDDKLLLPSSRELGASMSGAFTLWDEFLIPLTEELSNFLPALIERLLIVLAHDPLHTDNERDAEKEAFSLWLNHLVDWEAAFGAEHHSLQKRVLERCCLFGGCLVRKCGQQLLDTADDEFVEQWKELFEASALQHGADDDDHPMAGSAADESGILEHTSIYLADMDVDSVGRLDEPDIQGVGGWRRAPMSPRVPIGVMT